MAITPDQILPPEQEATRARVEAFARFMDTKFTLPGISVRFGWDNLVGLIPGIGEIITTTLSLYVIAEAVRMGVPQPVLMRMLANVAVDGALGAVPVVGDLADIAYKANRRNSALLLEYLRTPTAVTRRSRAMILLTVLAILLAVILILAASVLLAAWIWRMVTG